MLLQGKLFEILKFFRIAQELRVPKNENEFTATAVCKALSIFTFICI